MRETLTLRGRLWEIERPQVMGIINATPDSFHEPSRVEEREEAVRRASEMLAEGADILDIGACSTRPGSRPPSTEEELRRLGEVVPAIREAFPDAILSVDTFRTSIAEKCLSEWGVDIINDVGGGEDEGMLATVGRHGAIYVLMHKRGTPADMDSLADYGDVIADVAGELAFRLAEARKEGVANVIIDPGFGFAKTEEQGLKILARLDWLKVLGCPLLVGLSRKRMAPTPEATMALNAVAMEKGAAFIRVHDVRVAAQAAKTIGKLWNLE